MNQIAEQEIYHLPIRNQLTIERDGETMSKQVLGVPKAWLSEPLVVADLLRELGPFYFQRLQTLSGGMIQVLETPSGVTYRIRGLGWSLLQFAPVDIMVEKTRGEACYPIVGGVAVVGEPPKQGYLCLTLREDATTWQLGMVVKQFYPLLMGSGQIWRLRRWLYTYTQAIIHEQLAYDYLRKLALRLVSK